MPSTCSQIGRACARAGVAGNPSDALGGAAFAVPIRGLHATVELRESTRLGVRASRSVAGWSSVAELVEHAGRYGHDGGDRLVSAAIVTLSRHLDACAAGEHAAADGAAEAVQRRDGDVPFEAVWSTDIPRSVGLAGSSAIITATLRALAQRWRYDLEPQVLAALALETEAVELGVAAGWMDRAVQANDRPTLVDTRTCTDHGGHRVPTMTAVRPGAPVALVVAWDPAGAAPSGRLHGELHERAAAGEPLVVRTVERLVEAAGAAADAVERGDLDALADAVDATCELRDALGALDATTAALAASARRHGAAATSAGSGGAVLAVPRSTEAEQLAETFRRHGAQALPLTIEPDRAARD